MKLNIHFNMTIKGRKAQKHSEGKYKFPNMKTKILDGLGFLLHKLNSKRRQSSKHGCFGEIFGTCGSWSSLRGPKAAERLTDAGAQSCIIRVPSRESRPEHGLSSKWKPKPRTACGRHGTQCDVSLPVPSVVPTLGNRSRMRIQLSPGRAPGPLPPSCRFTPRTKNYTFTIHINLHVK